MKKGGKKRKSRNSPSQTKYISASDHKLPFPVAAGAGLLYFRDIYPSLSRGTRNESRSGTRRGKVNVKGELGPAQPEGRKPIDFIPQALPSYGNP